MKLQALLIAIVLTAATICVADFPTAPPGTVAPAIVPTEPLTVPISPERSKVGPFARTTVAIQECVRLANESGAFAPSVKLKESDVLYNGELQWHGYDSAERIRFSAADPRGKIAATKYIDLPAHDRRIPKGLNPNRSYTVPRQEMVDPPPLVIQITRHPDGTWSLDYLHGDHIRIDKRLH